MLERSPILAAMLDNALQKAILDSEVNEIIGIDIFLSISVSHFF